LTKTLADDLLHYMVSRYPDAIIANFKFLTSGFESEIYTFHLELPGSAGKSLILRLFPGDGAEGKLEQEARALSLLRQAGFPVPGLFTQETDPTFLGKPFEIIEKLEGQALWPALATAPSDQTEDLLGRFGALLAQLHQVDWRLADVQAHKDPASLLDEILAGYRSLYRKYDLKGFLQVIEWLHGQRSEITVQPAIVHQDFHANNVFLCEDGELFVIDWTQFAVSDYRVDLCWTLLIMCDLGNPEWREPILESYATTFGRPVEDLNYFNVIVYMKLLASAVISFTHSPEEQGLQPEAVDAIRRQLPVYKRLSQYIQTITDVQIPELENMLNNI
jgi:aminoglycoside phosphotransferase (APT) family kinase protein